MSKNIIEFTSIDFASRAREINKESLQEKAFFLAGEVNNAPEHCKGVHLREYRRTLNALEVLQGLEVTPD
jgi:hypothetical protein